MACADHPRCHQGHQPWSGTSKSSWAPASTLQMSAIFEGVLDAFKLIRYQPNFKHIYIRACGDHPKCPQGHQCQAGTSISSSTSARTPEMSSIFEGVLDAFKLIRFKPNFKHRSISCYKLHQQPNVWPDFDQPKLNPNLSPRHGQAKPSQPWTNPKLCNVLAKSQKNFIKFEI